MAGPRMKRLGSGPSSLPDMLRELEGGRPLIRFTRKRAPTPRVYRIRQDTRELLVTKAGSDKSDRVVVNLREVREIRFNQKSKDFTKWAPETKDHRVDRSFVLLHGNEFVLKTFSAVAPNDDEFRKWSVCLKYLVEESQNAPYPTVIRRWLQSEFYGLENKSHMVSNKDVKNWYTKYGLKPGTKFKEIYQEIEVTSGDINFDQFSRLYQNIIFQSNIFHEYFSAHFTGGVLRLDNFQMFLKYEQKETFTDDVTKVKEVMQSCLDGRDNTQFTPNQFMDYLYSEHNCVANLSKTPREEDMAKPLSQYWISSSHNTYLTGDQITSESSCEAYVRVLRQGCKCIELDCWDGDKEPIIYHGRTLTSKILFRDVIGTIRDYAWDVSEYPLILSIENHCSLPQQKIMADGFKKVFGDMLLREPIKSSVNHLPSPNELKRKIIIKHKKLKDGADEFITFGEEIAADDLSQSKMSGLLYLQDLIDQMWKPHFFVLTSGKLLFTNETQLQPAQEEDDQEEEDDMMIQLWFHSNISRQMTLQQLEILGPKFGDGAFLVRPSQHQPQDGYSLSFWRQGKVNHCRINSQMVNGRLQYWLIDILKFENLTDLVKYYQKHSLHCKDFHQVLGQPVTSQILFTRDEWYHDNLSRYDANEMLAKVPIEGTFLIRKREQGSYAISFRAEGEIKHCRCNEDAEGYIVLGSAVFESLQELVEYYRKTPLYRKMRLRYPTNKNLVARLGGEIDESIYSNQYYIMPAEYTSDVYARAFHDYKGRSESEHSFMEGTIITNINKVHEETWWCGDIGEKRQKWFPCNYVKELEAPPEDDSSLGALEQGEVAIKGCSVLTVERKDEPFPYRFRVTTKEGKSVEVACWTATEATEWADAIRETESQLTAMALSQRKKDELSKKERINVDLSDLVVYCQTVDFDPRKLGNPCEMSSLAETKAEKWAGRLKLSQTLNRYNTRQFSRVYPKGKRIDSSNYDPTPMWSAGCQLVALNFQTPDLPMQLNHGRFLSNGGCGYVLKPDFMNRKEFDPQKQNQLRGVDPMSISITVLGARNLPKRGRDIPCSYVEIAIHGCPYDSKFNRSTTGIKNGNGLNPVWKESCIFDIINPDMALIHFTVNDSDIFGDPNFLGQATYSVNSLRSGYRSVPLRNGYGEIQLASLLIHIELGNPQEDYQDVYTTIQKLQEEQYSIQYQVEENQLAGNTAEAERLRRELHGMRDNLEDMKMERKNRIRQKGRKRPVANQKSR